MTISATLIRARDAIFNSDKRKIVRPVQMRSDWQTIIDVGGMVEASGAGADADIVNPAAQIVHVTRHKGYSDGVGTTALFRMGYDDGDTPSVDPIIQVFGQFNASGLYQRLYNKCNVADITLTTAVAADYTDGTDFFTHPGVADQACFLMGCDIILVGVKTIYAVSGGSAALAYLQVKFF